MIRFHKIYFAAFLPLFLVEVVIAVFIRDRFIRPYLGDVLVVLLLYCFVRSFLNLKVFTVVSAVLGFALLVELLQLFNAVTFLGLQDNSVARTVLGSSFDWWDIAAYVAGAFLILAVEKTPLLKLKLKRYG